jgi:SAM-dependent methyltransferase
MDEHLLLSFADLERSHWWFTVRRRIVSEAVGALGVSGSLSILEVGCGVGGMLGELRTRFPEARVCGVEPNDAAAAIARGYGCPVDRGTFEHLPAADASVDLLVALDVLEHCEDDSQALAEAHRVLVPGAPLVLTVPALPSLWSQHDDDNRHFRRYTKRTLRDAIADSGLVIERITYFNGLLLPVAYPARHLARVTGWRKALGVGRPPSPLNALLKAIFSVERVLLRHTDLPTGMSLLAIVRKPEA